MKLSHFLHEASASQDQNVNAEKMHDKAFLQSLAGNLLSRGFPKEFDLKFRVSNGQELLLTFEMDDKTLNDEMSYHIVTFTYTPTAKSATRVHSMVSSAPDDARDALEDELSFAVNTIEVIAEFGKEFENVRAEAY